MDNFLKVQRKVKSAPQSIAGNPYALITDNIITEVVYMQDYDSSEIEETLKKHNYDEYVVCSEYGKELYVGERKFNDEFVVNSPFTSWIFSAEDGYWMPPVQYPEDGLYYNWNEDAIFWIECVPCSHMVKEAIN